MLFGVLACSVPARTASPTATGSSSKSIMILKNPRSGSSYFMGLLNAFPTIHVTDDILTPHSFRFGNVSADWLEYLSSALREPITRYDTIRARTFNETAIINRRRKQLYGDDEMDKRWHALDLVGFSICPSIHAFELDLRELAAVAPQTYLVVYIRTNKIKQAVAQLRGEKMKAECPNAVSRGGRLSSGDVAGKKEPCRVSETLHVDTEDLALALGTAFYREEHLLRQALKLSLAFNTEVYQVSYESLLGAPGPAVTALLQFLGLGRLAAESGPVDQGWNEQPEPFNSIDDLRRVIENYDQIHKWLEEKAPCLLSHLNATKPSTTHRLPSCRSAFSAEIQYQEESHRAHWEQIQKAPKFVRNKNPRHPHGWAKLKGKQLTKHRKQGFPQQEQ